MIRRADMVELRDTDPCSDEYDVGTVLSVVGDEVSVRWMVSCATYRYCADDLRTLSPLKLAQRIVQIKRGAA